MKIWRKRLTQRINELIDDEAVYRTAPATPGLLITIAKITLGQISHITMGNTFNIAEYSSF